MLREVGSLADRDLESLAKSFISPELAKQAKLFRVDSQHGAELVGRNGSGNYSGIAFPYLWPGDVSIREYRLRRDYPDLEQQSDGSIKEKGKYLSPPGRGNLLYFTPGTDASWLEDCALPILITEGEKKTLALHRLAFHDRPTDKPRFLPVGVPGVWNWRGRVGKTQDEHGVRRDIKGVIADFNRINWRKRLVYIVFDADASNNDSVQAARRQLAKTLEERGASVKLVNLPQFQGANGVDDLLALKGPDDVIALIEEAKDSRSKNALTPSVWLNQRFPLLRAEFGEPVFEQTDKRGRVFVQDVGEEFLAATFGAKANAEAPTVFLPPETKFYSYSPTEGIFLHQREPALQSKLSGLLLQCARDCQSENCDTQALAFRFRNSAFLSAVLRKARGVLAVQDDFFSTDLADYIPCANGMLRLSDNALLPFSSTYRRRNKLAVPYDVAATCPLFLDTLMIPALDQADQDLLQRWCGLALIGENLAQKLLILTGTPGGGKGTFVRILAGVIGTINIGSLRPQLLNERFEIGRLMGKTLLYGADVPENFLNQRGASVLKSLTGYDPMTLEFKNSNESPYITCKFNVIVTCNSRLTVRLEGDTEAWRRRLIIIDYHKPKPAQIIADLDQRILRTEASGVLNWMLQGLERLRDDSWQLRLTDGQQTVVDNLLLESDSHGVFARDCLSRVQGKQMIVSDCYSAYVEFCNERGWTAQSRNSFGHVIGDTVARRFGVTIRNDIPDPRGKLQRGWQGLGLREMVQTE